MSHRPRKRFGQNFLHDPEIIRRIVEAVNPQPGETLLEIGPGEGAITLPLLEACGRLQVVELDRDLVGPLAERARGRGELSVHNQDALRTDFCALAGGRRLRLVGNLPYNISTPLLFHLLEQARCLEDMHFMLQKEVVERMAAAPGTPAYGRLSVMIQYRCAVTPLFLIGPGAFRPPPKVDSAFVRLVPHAQPPVEVPDEALFARLVQQAFAQRRKTLRNTLRGLLDEDAIRSCGIDPQVRAEQLDLAAFATLANRAAGH
ncbi:16S rRNA (adenine(1518)-N(6)/adenine(1519)-N(6))-dimethyltransferase RsmA [Thiohalobacter sp. IOR34]|uniref:16S rRNA (adenine(1518)-N(6)/adenine(1519)-N(6))- dimethyltransferase RsmA n=1 Tax=Thiohalobacter sp. IOR34 TaxID=3057176 RepID=UPI0025AF51D7|nr:16S rRNA (adenine(1518)-N(6)/adenine(1519)-N(6))-dimethyltransferase RsmA [Thiohalobacter sp. IOR34]WJW75906.1 16S rRNA (adenine(1518)-N(6)/adenine(1519)-N(6))-dimethyltransferase RsmA [Thiohalobacter sp. IOR34]